MRVDETFQSFVGTRRFAAVSRKDPLRRLLRYRVDKGFAVGKYSRRLHRHEEFLEHSLRWGGAGSAGGARLNCRRERECAQQSRGRDGPRMAARRMAAPLNQL